VGWAGSDVLMTVLHVQVVGQFDAAMKTEAGVKLKPP
jgi:hypothetical protein